MQDNTMDTQNRSLSEIANEFGVSPTSSYPQPEYHTPTSGIGIDRDTNKMYTIEDVSDTTKIKKNMSEMTMGADNMMYRGTVKKKGYCKSPYRSDDSRDKAKESRKTKNKQKLAVRMKEKRHKRKNK